MMKLTVILLLALCLNATANGFAQKVSLSEKNVPLDQVFREIKRQTGYTFVYTEDLLHKAKKVTVTISNAPLVQVLNLCFQDQPLTYSIVNKIIVIKEKAEIPQKEQLSIPPPPSPINIQGKITNDKGEPLGGASVLEKGTGNTTITKEDGSFTLNVSKANAVLVVSYIGYETKEIAVNNQTNISVALAHTNASMSDVVVVGYGSKRKRDVTGTVSSISSDEIVKSKAPSAQEALQGRMPGVDVKRSSGKPGSDMTVEIRGVNSISQSTQPLYVVDNIPVSNINDINPADIERIDVLKDASSTAIFGSRGANGVVIVTTKKGSAGKAKITYDGYAGMVNAYNLPRMMNGPEFVAYARDYAKTRALTLGQDPSVVAADNKIFSATELKNIAGGTYTDWIDLIKRNSLQSNHLVTLSGGDPKTNYYLSIGYQQYEGAMKVENLKKYTLKVGVDKTFNNFFKYGASAYLTYSNSNLSSGEAFRSAYRLRPTGSAYNTDGSQRFLAYESEAQITNPLFDFENEIRKTQYIRVLPNLYVEFNPVKNLKFRSSFTPDITYQRGGYYRDTYTKARLGTQPSDAQYNTSHSFNYTLDNFLSYGKQSGDHKFDITGGSSINYYQNDFNSTTASGIPYRSLWYNLGSLTAITINNTTIQPTTTITSGYTKTTWASFLARANYSFKNRYLLTLTGRYDAASVLATGNKWNFFPSAGLAWVASDEDFLRDIEFINLLKFRFSYGKSGNANIDPYITQVNVVQSYYDFNGVASNGFAPSGLGNKQLSWEKTSEYNAGVELNVIQNRIGLQVDYYNRTSKGSILSQTIPAANGFNQVLSNVGSVRNSGIEAGLNTTNVKTSNFTWTSNISFSKNKNQIVELYGTNKNDIGNARFLGEKVRVFYNYKVLGVWQTSEAAAAAVYGQLPGQWKIQDTNKDNKISTADRVIIGSNIPDWFGGFSNNFTFRNFDLAFTIYTRQGVTEFSQFLSKFVDDDQGRARFNALKRDYWTPSNPTNQYANLAIETDVNRKLASEYIDASYTKISNATLGYNFNKAGLAKMKMSNLRLYATVYNPFIFTDFVGWDPETAGFDTFGLQSFRTRTFIFGVNIGL